jgi:hypothetical protein
VDLGLLFRKVSRPKPLNENPESILWLNVFKSAFETEHRKRLLVDNAVLARRVKPRSKPHAIQCDLTYQVMSGFQFDPAGFGLCGLKAR